MFDTNEEHILFDAGIRTPVPIKNPFIQPAVRHSAFRTPHSEHSVSLTQDPFRGQEHQKRGQHRPHVP
jgi:hypothetical protein